MEVLEKNSYFLLLFSEFHNGDFCLNTKGKKTKISREKGRSNFVDSISVKLNNYQRRKTAAIPKSIKKALINPFKGSKHK